MRISAFCTAVVTWVVVGHPPPAVAQVDQQRARSTSKKSRRSAYMWDDVVNRTPPGRCHRRP